MHGLISRQSTPAVQARGAYDDDNDATTCTDAALFLGRALFTHCFSEDANFIVLFIPYVNELLVLRSSRDSLG